MTLEGTGESLKCFLISNNLLKNKLQNWGNNLKMRKHCSRTDKRLPFTLFTSEVQFKSVADTFALRTSTSCRLPSYFAFIVFVSCGSQDVPDDQEDLGKRCRCGEQTPVVWWATALASIVFPQPGGPYMRTPLGGSMPIWGKQRDDTFRGSLLLCRMAADVRPPPHLLVKLEVRERQLHRLPDLLLLDVHPSDVGVHHVWLLIWNPNSFHQGEEQQPRGVSSGRRTWGQHHDAAVCLRREDVHQRVAVLVQRHRGVGLQQLSVDGAQDADVVVGAWKEEPVRPNKESTTGKTLLQVFGEHLPCPPAETHLWWSPRWPCSGPRPPGTDRWPEGCSVSSSPPPERAGTPSSGSSAHLWCTPPALPGTPAPAAASAKERGPQSELLRTVSRTGHRTSTSALLGGQMLHQSDI